MTFWQENYTFIREVYDTRYQKMVEWMDNVEMAIQKVCASKVYTSAEFKREKDNFHSLCKNLERAETKKWLTETLETLMKERAADEQNEEHIEKQDKVLNSLENKRKMVMDFIAKGEKLMQDPNCPKFLDGHVKKLREAWDDTNEKAQTRKKALADNLSSWETFENEKVENHKQLDLADAEFDNIKKIFDLKAGPTDYEMRMKTAANFRKGIEGLFDTVSGANDCLQQMLPDEKKQPMADEVGEIKTRMERLTKTDERLAFILDFNQRLAVFDKNVIE